MSKFEIFEYEKYKIIPKIKLEEDNEFAYMVFRFNFRHNSVENSKTEMIEYLKKN